jgi:hypothetical protein
MPLQATRNPEHLSMSRDSNSTKQFRLGGDADVHLGDKTASFIGSSFRPAHARSCGSEFDALAAQSTVRFSSKPA